MKLKPILLWAEWFLSSFIWVGFWHWVYHNINDAVWWVMVCYVWAGALTILHFVWLVGRSTKEEHHPEVRYFWTSSGHKVTATKVDGADGHYKGHYTLETSDI